MPFLNAALVVPGAVDWLEPLTSALRSIATFIPKLLVFLIVFLIGYFIAKAVARFVGMILTRIGDVPGSSQFIRVMLFAIVMANIAGFIASAQAYTDAVLALTTGFLLGGLFASAALDERLPATEAIPATEQQGSSPLRPLPSAP